jgi:hypothetical protein
MVVAGAAAGLCNEHTGPTLIVAYVALGVTLIRRRRAVWPWVVAGAIGVIAGYLALYLAPANAIRDGGKGAVSVVARVAAYGPLGPLRVLGVLVQEAAGAIAVLVVVGGYHLRRGTLPRATWWLLAAAIAIALTALGSPRWVGRLFLAPALLVIAAIIAMLDRIQLRRLAIAFATAIAIGHAIVFFTVQADLHADYAGRDAILRRAPPGSIPTVAPVRHWAPVHWAFGDDLRYAGWRTWIAEQYGLERIDVTTR